MQYTKKNIKIRLVTIAIAFVLLYINAYFLRDANSRSSSYFLFIIMVISIVKDYIGWKKYKKENSQIKG